MDLFFKWMPLLALLAQALLAWIMWSMRREFVRRDDCVACATALANRVCTVEAGLSSMPSPESWTKMQVTLEDQRGSVRVVLAKLEGQEALLKRIEHPMQLLMEHHLRGRE
jgi:hypothetical protein